MVRSIFLLFLAIGLSMEFRLEDGNLKNLPEGIDMPGAVEDEQNPVGTCPEKDFDFPTYLPDGKDCRVFYQCVHGIPIKLSCTDLLEFNSVINACDYPHTSGCSINKFH